MATGTDITIHTTTAVKVPLTRLQCEMLRDMCRERALELIYARRKRGQSAVLRAAAEPVKNDLYSLAHLLDKAMEQVRPEFHAKMVANGDNIENVG